MRLGFGTTMLAAAAALALGCGGARTAEAAFTFTILQQGSDVVVAGAGTLNLAGLGPGGGGPVPALIKGSAAALTTPGDIELYALVEGPSAFGTGDEVAATSSSGDAVYLDGTARIIGVPQGYMSGEALSASMTFAGATLASLGLTPGTYVWSWGDPGAGDTLTVQVGAVPEPASLMLLGAGLAALVAARRRASGGPG